MSKGLLAYLLSVEILKCFVKWWGSADVGWWWCGGGGSGGGGGGVGTDLNILDANFQMSLLSSLWAAVLLICKQGDFKSSL